MKLKHQKKRCRKVEYTSRRAARDALNEFGRARGAIRYYRCYFHGDREVWHLTSVRK